MGKTKDGSVAASWDRDLTNAFCDIALREIGLGNRPTTHFSKEGWANFVHGFNERTGHSYDKTQLKNRWDHLKKDWKIWKELQRGSTGLGWDPVRRTIDAPDEWWQEKLQVCPNGRKFRYNGIDPETEEKLDQMFGGIVATGHRAWAPSMTTPTGNTEMNADVDVDVDDDVDVDMEECGNFSQARCTNTGRSKRKRQGAQAEYEEKVARMVTACETICTNSAKSVTGPSSMATATSLLESTPEIHDDMGLYFYALRFLKDRENRETFLNMKPEHRLAYLRHCYLHGLP